MLIFDRDGNEETMCGNGIRCLARYFFDRYTNKNEANILTNTKYKAMYMINPTAKPSAAPLKHISVTSKILFRFIFF